jgi:hypothetical protein
MLVACQRYVLSMRFVGARFSDDAVEEGKLALYWRAGAA